MKPKTGRLIGASLFVLLLIAVPAQAQSTCGDKWPDDGFNRRPPERHAD